MKSVTLITHNLSLGGVQKNVTLLANQLAANFSIRVVLFESKPIEQSLAKNVAISFLPEKKLAAAILSKVNPNDTVTVGKQLFDFRVKCLGQLTDRLGSDLYISFEDYNNLISLHAIKLHSPNQRLIISSRVSLEIYRGALIHLLDKQFYLTRIAKDYPKADAVVAVSLGVARELCGLGLTPTTIQNGIPPLMPVEREPAPAAARPHFLSVGRMNNRHKGQSDLLRAYARIAEEVDERLIIVGDGPDRDLITNLAQQLEMAKRVTITGYDPHPWKDLSQTTAFVFPSFFEGLPNTLLEAMALGLPTISYDFTPSCDEILAGGEFGVKVARGDISGLAQAMKAMSHDVAMRQRYRRKSLESAKRFDLAATLAKWELLVQGLLEH
ncbi:MAG: glycosyltransferase [Deltaproteobacteria bacterium]|nr:glycosyltransferase [Deltaproteobacteria bacterium]